MHSKFEVTKRSQYGCKDLNRGKRGFSDEREVSRNVYKIRHTLSSVQTILKALSGRRERGMEEDTIDDLAALSLPNFSISLTLSKGQMVTDACLVCASQ